MNVINKTKINNKLIKNIQKMINHFENYNFVTKNYKYPNLHFGPNTERLKEIIRNEWILTNAIVCDHPAFFFKSLNTDIQFRGAFEMVKGVVTEMPFSFVEIWDITPEENKQLQSETNIVDLLRNSFEICQGTILRNQILCPPDTGVEYFHKQQRERKIWWRKFSALPGRFQITQVTVDDNQKSQSVEIKAEFNWGSETVETIKYFPERMICKDKFFEMKKGQKKFVPHIISCETFLEKIALTYLCDAYEDINENKDREVLKFCRKLAPYKISFAAKGSNANDNHNLRDLAFLLAKKIRKCGISVLLLPDVYSSSLECQILRNDALGIPYTILLNDRTLKDGIIEIRSRDTTLKEQSHVSLVVSYVEKLMKNY